MISPEALRDYQSLVSAGIEVIRTKSEVNFTLGVLAYTAKKAYGYKYTEYASAINADSTTLSEYARLYEYYRSEGLPDNLVQDIARLKEITIGETPILSYTHWREAKRLYQLADGESRVAQVKHSVHFLSEAAQVGWSINKCRVEITALLRGKPVEYRTVKFDSATLGETSALGIAQFVQQHVRDIRGKGNRVQVVVYEIEDKTD